MVVLDGDHLSYPFLTHDHSTSSATTSTATPAEKSCIINGALNVIYLFKLGIPKPNLFLIFCIFYGFEFFSDACVVKILDSKFRVPFMSIRLPPLLSVENLKFSFSTLHALAVNLSVLLYAQRSVEELSADDLDIGLNATDNVTEIIGG